MAEGFIRFDRVRKVYQAGEVAVTALHDASFDIERGEICVIVGESGAGKTTLLNILGGMDSLTDGSVIVDGKEVSSFSKSELTAYRRHDVGFVFQFYNLIPNLTALENIEIAAKLSPMALNARQVLEQVGLKDRAANFPAQLSGGEQQRVAIARALAKNPKLLLCDEPTTGLPHRQGNPEAAAGHQPQAGHDRYHHHPQQGTMRHGRPGDPRQERYRPVRQCQSPRNPDRRDRMVST